MPPRPLSLVLAVAGALALAPAANAQVTASVSGGTLEIQGSDATDQVMIARYSGYGGPSGGTLSGVMVQSQNGVTGCTTMAPQVTLCEDVERARVLLGDGDDNVSIGQQPGQPGVGPVELDGGPGRDSLNAGQSPDPAVLRGGAGEDFLIGGPAADVIDAADGERDQVQCGPGEDLQIAHDEIDLVTPDCEGRVVPPPPPVPTYPGSPVPLPPGVYPPGVVPPGVLPPGVLPPGVRPPSRPSRPGSGLSVTLDGALVPVGNTAHQKLIFRGGAGTVIGRLLGLDGSVVAEARATTKGGFSRGELVFTLPPGIGGALGAATRVPLRLEITVEGAEAPLVAQSTALVAPPKSRFRLTGRRYLGGFGVERIKGTARNDDLAGASGNDTLLGLAGDDRLNGGTGNDRGFGGPGNDEIDGFDGDDRSFGGPGDDAIIESRFGDDFLYGEEGNDYIVGGRGHDHMYGGPGDDVLDGSSAPDWFDCGPGDDIAIIDNQSERTSARMKDCETVIQAPKIESRLCRQGGTDAAETLLGTEGPDTCRGRGGDDDLEGRGGNDKLFGGGGNDRIFGRFGDDLMDGGPGNDELEGGRGSDTLRGGPGNDQLNGGFAPDRLFGGAGEDLLISQGGGKDLVDCGPGKDTAYADKADTVRNCETVKRPK